MKIKWKLKEVHLHAGVDDDREERDAEDVEQVQKFQQPHFSAGTSDLHVEEVEELSEQAQKFQQTQLSVSPSVPVSVVGGSLDQSANEVLTSIHP